MEPTLTVRFTNRELSRTMYECGSKPLIYVIKIGTKCYIDKTNNHLRDLIQGHYTSIRIGGHHNMQMMLDYENNEAKDSSVDIFLLEGYSEEEMQYALVDIEEHYKLYEQYERGSFLTYKELMERRKESLKRREKNRPKRKSTKAKATHQYCSSSGELIKSFETVTAARKDLKEKGIKGNISPGKRKDDGSLPIVAKQFIYSYNLCENILTFEETVAAPSNYSCI